MLSASHWLLAQARFCGRTHLHRIQPRPQVKGIFRYLRPDAPVSTSTVFTAPGAWWHFGNHLVDIILERMQLSQHPLIHSTCGHNDISVITPVLSIYLSTTSAVFTPAGHVDILQKSVTFVLKNYKVIMVRVYQILLDSREPLMRET